MSKNDEVQFLRLGDLVEFRRGTQLKDADRLDGPFPVVTAGRVANGSYGESNYQGPSVTISSHGAYAGFVGYWDSPIWLANNVFLAELTVGLLEPRFLYFSLKSIERKLSRTSQGGGVPYINARDLAKLRIPVPSLDIQREIVRILDQFTELEAELEAELDARRRQFEHYRLRLLSLTGAERKEMNLGDIGKVLMCRRVLKDQTTVTGDVPFFKIGTFGGEPDAYISRDLYEEYRERFPFPRKGEILISAAGTIGKTVVYHGEPAYFQDSNIVWIRNDESVVRNDYLYHLLKVIHWGTDGGTIRRLYNQNIQRARISVPPLSIQEEVAERLGRLESFVSDLDSGLPAELNARRKQYEYYRDQLLTFDEVAA